MARKLIVLACAVAAMGACVPPEESNDRIRSYDPEQSIMGQIQERGVMRIGVPSDFPPFVVAEPGAPGAEGFVVELGRLAAESLGVDAEFIAAPSHRLFTMVQVDPENPQEDTPADLVFPMVQINEDLVKTWTVTDPYWISHRRALLDGSRVLLEGPDLYLLRRAYATGEGKIGGEQDTTAGIGALVRTGAATFATIVSQVFNEADAEGDWSRFYEEWLAEYFVEPDPDDVPIMSVEEAAALYPTT